MTRAGIELAAGSARAALGRMQAAVDALERSDPFARLPYALGGVLVILRDLGELDAALALIDRCEIESERLGLGFAVSDFRAQRASLLARGGDLAGAEVALAQAAGHRGTWRNLFHLEADADVALLRGDAAAASAAAQRALKSATAAPMPWRVRCTLDMGRVLAAAGAPALARDALDTTLALLDERFPAQRGRHHRAWLRAARACLEYEMGDLDGACDTLRDAWQEAGEEAGFLVRARWPAIQPVLWHALAREAIDPQEAFAAIEQAVPGGDAMLAMVGHPVAAVRRAALCSALAASHPVVCARRTTHHHGCSARSGHGHRSRQDRRDSGDVKSVVHSCRHELSDLVGQVARRDDGRRGTECTCQLQLRRIGVDCQDGTRSGQDRCLYDIQTNSTTAHHEYGLAGPYLGDISHGTKSCDDTTTQ